jgi:cysteine desulfurase / selenocysteine lyase
MATFSDLVADALTRVPQASCDDLSKADQDKIRILDVRESDETQSGVLFNAVLLPRGLLEQFAPEHLPRKDQPVYVYDSTGERAALAADSLLKLGYKKVFALKGGIEAWRHGGLPVSGTPAVCHLPGARLSWADIRSEFAIVSRKVPVLGSGERPLVYLDHAASTHAPASVLKAYCEFMEREYANVHRGTHLLSRKATERFEESYYVIADFLGAELKQGCVVFTSNTTTAIDLCSHVMSARPGKVVTTEMEHHSNELTHRARGPLLRARVTDTGELDLAHLEELLRNNDVKLVCVTAGSNVTGLMPDVHRIARMAHEHGALVLVDAAQALAHVPIDVKPFEHPEHLDFVAGAGHKAYAPFGAGFLYGPRAILDEAPPYVPGGGTAASVTARGADFMKSPDRHHGGTPNIAGVVAMSRSLLFLQNIGMAEVRKHELSLLEKAMRGLLNLGAVQIYGPTDVAKRLGVISFNVEGISELLTAAVLSEEGAVAVRNGRFCAHIYMSRLLETHHRVVDASMRMGEGPPTLQHTGAVRASIGLYNDETDVERLLEFVKRVRERHWVGRYKTSGDTVSAAFASRCADRWMEATGGAEAVYAEPELDESSYQFEVLQPDGACRTYLIADKETREAALVDPLREKVDGYLALLAEKNLTLKYTIETHTHADHLSGSARLKERTGAKMLMHHASPAVCVDGPLRDGDQVKLGKMAIDIIASPGHTRDSVCLVLPGRVLTGDTLLIGGCGRTDLPGGDSAEMFDSLQKLLALPDDTLVLPAHDYDGRRATTIGRERQSNPRLKLASSKDFIEQMGKQNLPKPRGMTDVLATNQQCL